MLAFHVTATTEDSYFVLDGDPDPPIERRPPTTVQHFQLLLQSYCLTGLTFFRYFKLGWSKKLASCGPLLLSSNQPRKSTERRLKQCYWFLSFWTTTTTHTLTVDTWKNVCEKKVISQIRTSKDLVAKSAFSAVYNRNNSKLFVIW